jgi:murein endopeptidase
MPARRDLGSPNLITPADDLNIPPPRHWRQVLFLRENFVPLSKDYERLAGLNPGVPSPGSQEARLARRAAAGATAGTAAEAVGVRSRVTSRLPSEGLGFYTYKRAVARYGVPETIRALETIAASWQKAHPSGPRIGIGDISLEGGGPIQDHRSHRIGIDVDIRLMRNDGREEGVVYQSPAYSRRLTQELIDLIWANSILRVETILFNDPRARDVVAYPNHDNHLHVRFLASRGRLAQIQLPRAR